MWTNVRNVFTVKFKSDLRRKSILKLSPPTTLWRVKCSALQHNEFSSSDANTFNYVEVTTPSGVSYDLNRDLCINWPKSVNFFWTRDYLMDPQRGFPWITMLGSKQEWWGYVTIKSFMISLAVWIQYTSVTDGQTDRHRPTTSTAKTHSVAR